MKTKKTKKILGGVAIAAVSLGCLGLAGIANASTLTDTGSSTKGSAPATTTYPFYAGKVSSAMKGNTEVTFNVSTAQGQTLLDHHLTYIQIGSYSPIGSSNFNTISTTQDAANAIGTWASQNSTLLGGTAYNPATDGDPLTWLLTGNSSSTFLGTDLSGQGSTTLDQAVRSLANYLSTQASSSGLLGTSGTSITFGKTSDNSAGAQQGTWDAPAPGVYLVLDSDGTNQSMPMIVATEPGNGFQVPSTMTDLITNQVALKTQDPLTAPDKQFVTGATWKDNAISGGKLSGTSDTASVGMQNAVTYQVAGVFPNFTGYPSYSYSFVDNPGTGLTLYIQGGQNLDVAGIPVSTLMGDVSGGVTVTEAFPTGNSNGTISASSASELANLKNLTGGSDASLTVTLNKAALEELITLKAQATTETTGDDINSAGDLANYSVTTPDAKTPNTTQGFNGGKTSYTGQTDPVQYFGLTYQGYLNSDVATASGSSTSASNTATVVNNGVSSSQSGNAPLSTSGTYNGGTNPQGNGKTSTDHPGSTQQIPASKITGTDNNGTTNGVPNKTAVGAGINWMKIWGSGEPATGAVFQVSRGSGSSQQWLYATGSGWGWASSQADGEYFGASTLDSSAGTTASGGLFEISGIGDGTYQVHEVKQATGAAAVLPVFSVTVSSGSPETVSLSGAGDSGYNLVNNTPDGNPFNSKDFNTVENVKSMTGLPLTGGAGILTGVIAAVLLFGTAGIVLVVYKRRKKAQED